MIKRRFPDNIPEELLLIVADFLTPKNIASCLRVSKHWNKVFHPLFWRNISVTSPTANRYFSNAPDNKLIQTNAPLVRSLKCHFFTALHPFCQSKKMTNLQRLDLWGLVLPNNNKAILWVPLLKLIARNPGLKYLTIYNLCGTVDNLAAKTFPFLPNLTAMKLHAGRSVSTKSLEAFLELLPPSIRYLKLHLSVSGEKKYLAQPGSAYPVLNLRHLVCAGFMSDCEIVMKNLIKRCPDLETLTCESSLSKLTLDAPCPKLRNLIFDDDFIGFMSDEQRGALLTRWISPLGLRSVDMVADKKPVGPLTIVAMHKHDSTLQEIKTSKLEGADLITFLYSCSQLRVLQSGSKSAEDPSKVDSFSSYLEEMRIERGQPQVVYDFTVNAPVLVASTPEVWLSAGTLTTLEMLLSNIPRPDLQGVVIRDKMLGPYPDSLWQESRTLQKQVYTRLGHCKRLRKLILGVSVVRALDVRAANNCIYEGLEFSLDSGLGLLAGLEDLRVLDVQMLEHKIGIPELEWMKLHWKKLERIIGLEPDETSLKWIKKHKPAWIRPLPPKIEDPDYVAPQKTSPFRTWTYVGH
ncbi:hypothetical protein BGZ83_006496 [Gryganskiella cystojenkinii]|nr:hypothetical protein BGZ83_006496 [Gryganskiella cystojenkinii]